MHGELMLPALNILPQFIHMHEGAALTLGSILHIAEGASQHKGPKVTKAA